MIAVNIVSLAPFCRRTYKGNPYRDIDSAPSLLEIKRREQLHQDDNKRCRQANEGENRENWPSVGGR